MQVPANDAGPSVPPPSGEPGLEELYPIDSALSVYGLTLAVLIVHLLTNNSGILALERPLVFQIGLVLTLAAAALGGRVLTQILLRRTNLELGAVILWSYPLATLVLAQVVLITIVVAVPMYCGRSFWSDLLQTNYKTVTVLFSTNGLAFGLCLMVAILGASGRYLKLLLMRLEVPPEGFVAAADVRRDARQRARRVNRWVLWACFALLGLTGIYVIVARPEMILYYRAEIQLQTGRNAELALATFKHICDRYPSYRYLDTVELRAAWVIDRRLRQPEAAVSAYTRFIEKYGFANPWANDAVANIVSIELDQRHNATAAAHWARVYLDRYPYGNLWPHVALYEVRALRSMGSTQTADLRLSEATERCRDRLIPIYNREDDYVTRIPFELAVASQLSANSPHQ